jgi:small conductance mechanosensitive channel
MHVLLPPLSLATVIDRILGFLNVQPAVARRGAFNILFIWLLAWAAWQAVRLIARRIVAAADDHDDAVLTLREKRAETVAQLLRSVGDVAIFVFALILSLNQFTDIGPILGGAAVLGLAVSFGAQSLVKDIIAGFFILVENQFAVGDVVEIGGKGGVVERMTLRVVMLRDLDGTLHVIPNGNIQMVSNRTRGWSRAVIETDVAYESDIDAVLAVFRDEASQFGEESAWRSRLDGMPEVTGIEKFGESGVTIRVLIRTRPGSQWDAAREFRRRLKVRLDREGIDIPYPQRTVHVHQHPAPDPGLPASATIATPPVA